MAIMGLGEYKTSPPSWTTDGQHGKLQIDKHGSLKTYNVPSTDDSWTQVLGTGSTYGKVAADAVANNGYIWAAFSCEETPCNYIDWVISCDVAWEYQLAWSTGTPLSCTLVLSDATAVDNNDTFLFNGVTYTAKTSGAVAASHEYNLGANNGEAAANLTTLLAGANGIPGATASVVAGSGIDTITVSGDGFSTGMSAMDFGQGTSDTNEIAFTDTTATNCVLQGSLVQSMSATTGYVGYWVEQAMGGRPFGLIKLTNKSGSAAANFTVRALHR